MADAAKEQRRHASRHLETWVDDDGMLVIRGRLSPEVGAVVRRALEAAADRLHREAADGIDISAGQRRADALGLVAESALASALDRGPAGDRYQVVVHVDAGVLGEDATAGQSALEDADGLRVSAETSRRLACDAAIVLMRHDPNGRVVDVGRKTRTLSPALRRALAARDPRCRFPGCYARHCDAHHVRHWAQGGATTLANLVRLCRHHHRAVHEKGFTVTVGEDGKARFFRPDGHPLPAVPPAPRWAGAPLAPTLARLEAAGITVGPHTAAPHWQGERLDVAWAIDVLWRPPSGAPPAPDVSAETRQAIPCGSPPEGRQFDATGLLTAVERRGELLPDPQLFGHLRARKEDDLSPIGMNAQMS